MMDFESQGDVTRVKQVTLDEEDQRGDYDDQVSSSSLPSRWKSVGFCPIDASIRGWHGLASGIKRFWELFLALQGYSSLWPEAAEAQGMVP
ncbi:hypothetical protein Tco_0635426 [Tanacetum coccineum]